MTTRIPPDELITRGVYRVRGRNILVGVWTGHSWIGIREKFGETFLDECEVPERTCWAEEFVEMLPDEIETITHTPSVCQTCGERVDFDASRGEQWFERWQHIAGPSDHYARSMAPQYQPLFDYLEMTS